MNQADSAINLFGEFLITGGPVVWILMVLSVLALSVILLKLYYFVRTRPEHNEELEVSLGYWEAGKIEEALASLNQTRFSTPLITQAMSGVLSHRSDQDILREELDRVATNQLNELRAYLPILEIIGSMSPLLGLLGTVLGMIVAFQSMEMAGNDVNPAVLSGGIWQALLTTAVGLAIAIPVTAVHNWMDRKVHRVGEQLSDAVTRVFTASITLGATSGTDQTDDVE